MPCYSTTWDVNVVAKHMATMGMNDEWVFPSQAAQLVVLMALVEASRTSELRVLDIQFRTYKPEGVVFKSASLAQKRAPGLPLRSFSLGHSRVTSNCVCRVLTTGDQGETTIPVIYSSTQTSHITATGALCQRPSG